ncbi:hypothetical protein BH09MYX1_BH09MYX1_58250 [soil metagenome]
MGSMVSALLARLGLVPKAALPRARGGAATTTPFHLSKEPKTLAATKSMVPAHPSALGHDPLPVGRRSRHDENRDPKPGEDDPLDPLARHAAHLAPPLGAPASPPFTPTTSVAASPPPPLSLEQILPQLVRRLALAGDGKRATVRVEIGAGALAGATVVVSNETGGIRVHVEAPEGVDGSAWEARIRSRLEAKGLAIDSIHVGS